MGKTPKIPKVPSAEDKAVKDARRRAFLVEKGRKGRSSTILTGPSGLSGDSLAPQQTVLGGI